MAAFRTSRRNILIGGVAAVASQSVLAAFGKGHQSTKDSPNKGKNTGQRTRVQAVVIGSGFGGAIAAHRLGEKGIETLVLERGGLHGIQEWVVAAGRLRGACVRLYALTRLVAGRRTSLWPLRTKGG